MTMSRINVESYLYFFSCDLVTGPTFWLVKFVKTGALEIIPYTWRVNEMECFYPKTKRSDPDLLDSIKTCMQPIPKRNFKKWVVKYLFKSGNSSVCRELKCLFYI